MPGQLGSFLDGEPKSLFQDLRSSLAHSIRVACRDNMSRLMRTVARPTERNEQCLALGQRCYFYLVEIPLVGAYFALQR